MVSVVLNGEQFGFPESWEELFSTSAAATSLELKKWEPIEVLKLVCIGENNLDRNGWEVLIKQLLGCSDKYWENLILGIDQWVHLKNLSRWVFTEKLLIRPSVSFLANGKSFIICENISQVTAMHMAAGLAYFTQMGNGDDDAVDWLLAVFCEVNTPAPPYEGWEYIGKYSYKECEKKVALFDDLDPWIKVGVVKYLADSLADFIEARKDMFGKGGEPRYQNGEGWYFSLKNMAAKGYFSSILEAENTTAEKVWDLMMDDAFDNKEAVCSK